MVCVHKVSRLFRRNNVNGIFISIGIVKSLRNFHARTLVRTNNGSEGRHNSFRKLVGGHHMSI